MKKFQGKADIIIKNGCVIDGTGNPFYYADLAIKDDSISFIGNLGEAHAELVIDAEGKYVTPGFIDGHSHSDATIWANPECQSTIRQGITTEIVGNCGMMKQSFASDEKVAGDILSIYDEMPPLGTFKAVFDKIERMGVSENLGWLCGHNKLRQVAGITGQHYSEEQFSIMEKHLRESMEAGYLGFSTGLEFQPGKQATPEEISRLVGVIKDYDGIYTSHMRNRDSQVYEALEEFIDVLRTHQVRGVLSHFSIRENTGAPEDSWQHGIKMMHKARVEEKLNIWSDMIPSIWGMGPMPTILPSWVTDGGWEKAREILLDPEQRKQLRTDCDRYWRFIHQGEWDRVRVQTVPAHPEIATLEMPEIARLWGKDEWDCYFDIVASAKTKDESEKLVMMGRLFSEQDVIDCITDSIFMWSADGYSTVDSGPLAEVTANPKHYMDIMYFFTRYVRELKIIPIEKAVSKLTSLPATCFRLANRGQINVGFYADINIFDLNKLHTFATYENPGQYSKGMDYVIVNGVPVISEGKHTHSRPGKILR